MKNKLLLIILMLLLTTLTGLAQSGAPPLINFQGRLTNADGVAINSPTTIQIQIIQGGSATESQSSGTVVFRETATVTPDNNGVFNYLIGSSAANTNAATTLEPSDFDTTESLFLEVSIDGQPLLPRQRIVSAGYALSAGQASKALSAGTADNASKLDGRPASEYLRGRITTAQIEDGSITPAKIADGAVRNSHIALNSITGAHLASGAIQTNHLADGAITAAKLAAGAIGAGSLGSSAVSTSNLADSAVTGQKIAPGAISSAHLAIGSVSTDAIADSAITSAKLAPGAVSASNLANNAISASKLADGAVTGQKIAPGAITSVHLAAGSVSTNTIADSAITSAKLAAGALTTASLANQSVTTEKIADGSITGQKLALNAITGANIINGSITTDDLADGAITSAKIAPGAFQIKSSNGVAGTITAQNGLGINTVSISGMGNISVGAANQVSGSITVFNSGLGDSGITLDGASNRISVGAAGGAGTINLISSAGRTTLSLLGGPTNGAITLRDGNGSDTIKFDGGTAQLTLGRAGAGGEVITIGNLGNRAVSLSNSNGSGLVSLFDGLGNLRAELRANAGNGEGKLKLLDGTGREAFIVDAGVLSGDGSVFSSVEVGSQNNAGVIKTMTARGIPGTISGPNPDKGGGLIQVFDQSGRASIQLQGDDGTSKAVIRINGNNIGDYSEVFELEEKESLAPGSVVVIDSAEPGRLKLSTTEYDRCVAGVVSGADGVSPGIIMGARKDGTTDKPVALAGRVYTLVDASYGEIKPGDLLTTSPTPGHAMVVRDPARAYGAVLGKAMQGLKSGRGRILVLVSLQ